MVVNDLGGEPTATGADAGPAQQVVDEIVAAGGQAVANYDDIATWAGGEALVDQAVDDFGGLDVLVNNAGILRDRMSFNMNEEEWDAVIAVHLKGHFAVAASRRGVLAGEGEGDRRARPARRSSTPPASRASTATPARSNYAAAKAGIASMTIVMARELERLGVRVNAIAPVAPHPPHRGARRRPHEARRERVRPLRSRERRGRRRAGSRPTWRTASTDRS